jgi:pyridinium-3,5-biscarboxylic acid mononucleotide sulfurtransferase
MAADGLIASDQGREASWEVKLARLRAWFADHRRVLVAVSGGIDSTFLWKVATEELADDALAVTGVSASLASWERESLAALRAEIGGRHRTLDTAEVGNADYAANPPNRCYFCKDTLWRALGDVARAEQIPWILDGYNLDDVGDYRPGQDAGREHQILSPLKITGFRKADIRAAARSLGLSIWSKPAMACLSSRFAYGVPITDVELARVDAAERWLRERGFDQLRVRVHAGRLARLELPPDAFGRFLPLRDAFVAELNALGYLYVSLDLAGFRSGSMNAVLAP